MPGPILILTATAFEQQRLHKQLQNPIQQTVGHRTCMRGILANRPVMLLETGIGLVNTAQALTVMLQMVNPELVLQIGIGGAYLSTDLAVGDLALATEENYGELGIDTPTGWRPASEIGIPVLKTDQDYYNTYTLDPHLVRDAKTALQRADLTCATGPFITVQQCTGRAALGDVLANRFNGICENMEGAAAAHLCTLYNMPFLELRAMSNRVEDRNKEAWNIPLALERSQEATMELLKRL